MKFLAHGGAKRAERTRVGNWPEIPSGLLQDARLLGPDAPAFGLGVLQARPYLIFRELQPDGDNWAAYTFLLEPRPEDWELYRWNGAWMLASLLADVDAYQLLINEPEQATENALAGVLDRCQPIALGSDASSEILGGLLVRSSLEAERFTASMTGVNLDPHTQVEEFAAALHQVPIAFRTGRGWLVRGVDSHAAILGCSVLFEGPSPLSGDPSPGYKALARLEQIAASNPTVAELLSKPFCDWDSRGQGLLHGLRMLEQLETRTAQTWDLLQSVPAREGILRGEIRSAALRTMENSRQLLPFEPATLLLEDAEAGNRVLLPDVVERLDHGALMRFFTSRSTPPNPWPDWMETPRTLKSELWTRVVEAAKQGWAELARRAIADLSPDSPPDAATFAVVAAGVAKAREAGASPHEWASFGQYPELRSLLASWSIENVKKMRGDWEATYLVLGDDPGGRALAKSNLAGPIAARLVTYMWDQLAGPHGNRARAWVDALATSPMRDLVPLHTKLELAVTAGGRWTVLERLRKAYEGEPVSGESASIEERPHLLRELEALAQTASNRAPNLVAIRAVLGVDIPEATQRALTKGTKSEKGDKAASADWLKLVAKRLKDVAEAKSKSKPKAEEVEAKPEVTPAAEPPAPPTQRSGYFIPPKAAVPPPAAKEKPKERPKEQPKAKEPLPKAKPAPVTPPVAQKPTQPVTPPPTPKPVVSQPQKFVPPPPPPKPVVSQPSKPVTPPPSPPPKPVVSQPSKPVTPPPPSTPVVEAPPAPLPIAASAPKSIELPVPPKAVEVSPPRPVLEIPPPRPVEVSSLPKSGVPEPNQIELRPTDPPRSVPPQARPAAPPTVEPAIQPVRPDLREKLRVWVAGGNVADDRVGDEELLNLFENGNSSELAAARTIIEGFSAGLLYRLAGRSIANPRLLDGIARVLGGAMVDRIVRDAAHYDIARFAKVAAARLALNHGDWSHPVDQAVIRLLRSGNSELRKDLNREFLQTDPSLVDELARAIDPPPSSESAA